MAKISIIIPVYNSEIYLEKCIESILNQTFKDFELILVNDGSKDNSYEICEHYHKQDSRIKVINKVNGGVSSARNAGLNVANGKYIGFIDSDDYIHPQMYEILYNKLINTKSDIAICDYKKVYLKDNIETILFDEKIVSKNILKFSNIEALNQFYDKYGMRFTPMWNKLFKKTLFQNNKFEVGKCHEDEFIMHKLLYQSEYIIYIPIKLYYYFQSENSIMRKPFNILRLDAIDAYSQRVDFFKEINQKTLEEKALFAYSQEFLIHYFKFKKYFPKSNILRKIKKDYNSKFYEILKLHYYTKKEKLLLILFFINPVIYEKLIILKNKKNDS